MKITTNDIKIVWEEMDGGCFDGLWKSDTVLDQYFSITYEWDKHEHCSIYNCFLGSHMCDNGLCSFDSKDKVEEYVKQYLATEINKILV